MSRTSATVPVPRCAYSRRTAQVEAFAAVATGDVDARPDALSDGARREPLSAGGLLPDPFRDSPRRHRLAQ